VTQELIAAFGARWRCRGGSVKPRTSRTAVTAERTISTSQEEASRSWRRRLLDRPGRSERRLSDLKGAEISSWSLSGPRCH